MGSTITLTGSGTAAATNPWVSNKIDIATITSAGAASGVAAGDATITFTDNNGCTATKLLSVKASPVVANAGADKEICAGSSVTIGSPAQTGVTYSWNPTTGLSASNNVANPVANPIATTTYTLTANATGSQCSATDQVEVKVNPLPIITSAQRAGASSYIRPNASVNLTASTDGTASSWATGDATKVTIAAGTDPKKATATGVALGNANITYTDLKGCIGTHSITVSNKSDQTITFNSTPNKTVGDANFTLSATASSALPVTFSTTTDKVSISGNSVTILKAGKASIQADQAGSNSYDPAPQISNTFCINPAKPAIAYTESNKTLTSSASNGNQWYLNGNVIANAAGQTYTATADGSYTVKVTIEECTSAPSTPVSVLTKTSQTITFTPIPNKTVGDANFTLSATASSGLPVTFSTTTDKVSISGNSVTILKAGKASIQANQAGNNSYNPVTQISNTFCINPAKPAITYTDGNKTLTSSSPNGNQWFLNEKPISGATANTYTVPTDGSYTVKVTLEECASVLSEVKAIVVTGDIPDNEFHIYPNPVHDELVIQWPSREDGSITLSTITGQVLHSSQANGKTILSMKDFPVGIYILKIQTTGITVMKKVGRN